MWTLMVYVTTTEQCMMICTFVFTPCALASSCMSSTARVKRGFIPKTVCSVKILEQGRKKDYGLDCISSNYLFCTNYQRLGEVEKHIFPIQV